MQQSTVGMCSEELTGRRFCHCGNVIEQTYTSLDGTGWCSQAPGRCSMLLCTLKTKSSTGESDAGRRHGGMYEVAAGVSWYK